MSNRLLTLLSLGHCTFYHKSLAALAFFFNHFQISEYGMERPDLNHFIVSCYIGNAS